jgi:hypothetical protein
MFEDVLMLNFTDNIHVQVSRLRIKCKALEIGLIIKFIDYVYGYCLMIAFNDDA